MAYVVVALNHFRALKQCAEQFGLELKLDCSNFRLEAKGRGRYFTLYPQFVVSSNGTFMYVPQLTDTHAAFVGWLPYQPVSWDEVSDKLNFKRLMSQNGRRTPQIVRDHAAPEFPFLIKHSAGSFGNGIDGPFPAGFSLEGSILAGREAQARGQAFAEEFIPGSILKVWFWDRTPLFAHHQEFPRIVGTGSKTVSDLVQDKLRRVRQRLDGEGDHRAITRSLKLQGAELTDVLPEGQSLWIDYRYGRTYEPVSPTHTSDSAWHSLRAEVRSEAAEVGRLLGDRLVEHFGAPILYSVDAILAADDAVWWLETNTNPMAPPEIYTAVFETLFGPARTEGGPGALLPA